MKTDRPSRLREPAPVNLHRLPWPLKYGISLLVIAGVATAAWLVGRGRPVPPWITNWLVPSLGWIWLALAAVALAGALRRRFRTPPS